MAKYDLARFRKEHGITQKELAEMLEVSQGFMSSVENGRNPLPDERLSKLYRGYPTVDFEIYRIADDEKIMKVNSDNEHSPITINDPELIKAFLRFQQENNDEKGNEVVEQKTEMRTLLQSYQRLVDSTDEQRKTISDLQSKIDGYQTKIMELNEEILRLQKILLRHGITDD